MCEINQVIVCRINSVDESLQPERYAMGAWNMLLRCIVLIELNPIDIDVNFQVKAERP